jgi:hypothetical protein
MTEPIQAVEVPTPTPKPKLATRWVIVNDKRHPYSYDVCVTSCAFFTEKEARDRLEPNQRIYQLPASDEPEKSVVSSIPTEAEIRNILYTHGPYHDTSSKAIRALVASRVNTKPTVSAIPTVEDIWHAYSHAAFSARDWSEISAYEQNGFKAIYALVAARVVEHRPRVLPVVEEQPPKIDPGEPTLDPIKAIKAIVGILELKMNNYHQRADDKLVALKRSLGERGSRPSEP